MQKIERPSEGFSLLELIFALVIVSTILAITIPRIQSGLELHLKTSTRRLASAIRYSYYESVARNRYYRLVFELDKKPNYWLEVADKPVLIRTAEGEETFQRKLQSMSQEEREAYLEREPAFVRVEETLNKGVDLPRGVFFKDVYVAHQTAKIEQGFAYLYFFPNGATERAVINLADKDGNTYSLEVQPLTGKSRIRMGTWNYEEDSAALE